VVGAFQRSKSIIHPRPKESPRVSNERESGGGKSSFAAEKQNSSFSKGAVSCAAEKRSGPSSKGPVLLHDIAPW